MYPLFYKQKSGFSPSLAISYLLNHYKIRVTESTLNIFLDEHIEYPSLLAVKDTLHKFGIESAAVRKGKHAYADFEMPFICAIQQEDWGQACFTVVTAADDDKITYLNPATHNLKAIPVLEFNRMDKGVILLLDGSAGEDEPDYTTRKRKERLSNLFQQMPVFLLILTLTLATVRLFLSHTSIWINFLFLFGSASGLGISLLLLWHEIDRHSLFIKEVCGSLGKKRTAQRF